MRIWWSVGLMCTLLAIAMSATLGHRACVATAKAAPHPDGPPAVQHPALQGSRPIRPSISTFAMLISCK